MTPSSSHRGEEFLLWAEILIKTSFEVLSIKVFLKAIGTHQPANIGDLFVFSLWESPLWHDVPHWQVLNFYCQQRPTVFQWRATLFGNETLWTAFPYYSQKILSLVSRGFFNENWRKGKYRRYILNNDLTFKWEFTKEYTEIVIATYWKRYSSIHQISGFYAALLKALLNTLVETLLNELVEALLNALVKSLLKALLEVLLDDLVKALVDTIFNTLVEWNFALHWSNFCLTLWWKL